jgi:hypothetical protein
MKNILLSLLTCSILYSCVFGDCKQIKLKESDLDIISVYDDVDYLIFKSDSNNIDTLKIIGNSSSFSPCNKIELSQYQYESKTISIKNSSHHGDFYNGIGLSVSNNFTIKDKAILTISFHNVSGVHNGHNILDSVSLNDQKINCGRYNWNGKYGKTKSNAIQNFYWNDSLGFVSYKTQGGETFTLYKKQLLTQK